MTRVYLHDMSRAGKPTDTESRSMVSRDGGWGNRALLLMLMVWGDGAKCSRISNDYFKILWILHAENNNLHALKGWIIPTISWHFLSASRRKKKWKISSWPNISKDVLDRKQKEINAEEKSNKWDLTKEITLRVKEAGPRLGEERHATYLQQRLDSKCIKNAYKLIGKDNPIFF